VHGQIATIQCAGLRPGFTCMPDVRCSQQHRIVFMMAAMPFLACTVCLWAVGCCAVPLLYCACAKSLLKTGTSHSIGYDRTRHNSCIGRSTGCLMKGHWQLKACANGSRVALCCSLTGRWLTSSVVLVMWRWGQAMQAGRYAFCRVLGRCCCWAGIGPDAPTPDCMCWLVPIYLFLPASSGVQPWLNPANAELQGHSVLIH